MDNDGPFTVWGPKESASPNLMPTPIDPKVQAVLDLIKKSITDFLDATNKSMHIPFPPAGLAIGGAFEGYITGEAYEVVAFKIDKRNRLWLTGRNINKPQDMNHSRDLNKEFAPHRPRRHLKRKARTHIGHVIVTLRPTKPAEHITFKSVLDSDTRTFDAEL